MRTNLISILPVDNPKRKGSGAYPAGIPGDRQARPHVIESAELLRGREEVVILHNGREYRLRLTRLGKLILTA